MFMCFYISGFLLRFRQIFSPPHSVMTWKSHHTKIDHFRISWFFLGYFWDCINFLLDNFTVIAGYKRMLLENKDQWAQRQLYRTWFAKTINLEDNCLPDYIQYCNYKVVTVSGRLLTGSPCQFCIYIFVWIIIKRHWGWTNLWWFQMHIHLLVKLKSPKMNGIVRTL